MIGQYFLNMAMALDQFASTILGGHPDDTISQRLGRAKLAKSGSAIVEQSVKFVDSLAFLIVGEKNHCLRSLNGKTDAKELWNWGGSREMIQVSDD
jgi:hypothetical protein